MVLVLANFLVAQVDSTSVDTTEAPMEENIVQPVEAAVEDTVTQAAEVAVEDTITQPAELAVGDSTTEMVSQDTMAQELEETFEDLYAQPELPPIRVVGLINEGPLNFWSNDDLANLGFSGMENLSVEDPYLIAAKANDCLDIVCHLLATDSSHADYVVISSNDSSDVQVYEITTRAMVITAAPDKVAEAFGAYLRGEGLSPEPELATTPEPAIEAPPEMAAATTSVIKLRQHRSMDALFSNPANLAREFESFTTWNIIPDFGVNIHNSLLTPGWYKDWFTTGIHLKGATKDDYLSTLVDQELALNIVPEFQTLFGFRIGRYGFNTSVTSPIKMVLPGNLLALPMQDISLNNPIDNSDIEVEAIPMALKTSLSYAHPLSTPYGDVKVGANLNLYKAAGYMRMISDEFVVTLNQDSVFINASGESWATVAGIDGHIDSLVTDDFDAGQTMSELTMGIDIGAIMDLSDQLGQDVEVQLSLSNIGAKYKWTGVTHETWTYTVATTADSVEQHQISESEVIGDDEELEVNIPTVLKLHAIYQPFPTLLVGAGIEKAFTDEARLGYSPDFGFSFQLNYYPAKWFDISYYMQPRFGDLAHTFGSGFHFGFLDAGLTMSFINGINSNAKGIGFGLQSNLHF
jgi:hypothetical protein